MTVRTDYFNLIKRLLLLHVIFIFLSPLVMEIIPLSLVWPGIYLLALMAAGYFLAPQTKRPPLAALLAGYCSQLPGITCSVIVLIGIARNKLVADTFDFIIQVWQTTFNSWFPYLPHTQPLGITSYYLVTLGISFLLPLFPAAGSLLSTYIKRRSAHRAEAR